MINKGEFVQVCCGVYITSLDDPRYPIASMIQSPSYISFQTAPEKALCDTLYKIRSILTINAVELI